MVKRKVLSLPVLLAKQDVSAFPCLLLIDPYRLHRSGLSRDAVATVESKMSLPVSLTFLLAKQEESAFSCLLFIDPCHFHREGVSRNVEHNGGVQNGFTSCFACQTGIGTIFCLHLCRFRTKGFLRIPNTLVKSKMLSPPVLLASQEVPAFSCLELIDKCRYLRKVGFLGCGTPWISP